MADLPEYQQHVKIEPAPVAEFSSALNAVGKSWEVVGALGNQLAQSAANERVRQSALEAGRNNPGQTIIPPFTKADEQYANTYRQQEYATALNSGTKFLDKLVFNSRKNPNQNTIAEMEGIGAQGIHELTKNLTPETGNALKDQLSASLQAASYDLQKELYAKGERYKKENIAHALEQANKELPKLVASGDVVTVDKFYKAMDTLINDLDVSDSQKNSYKETLRNTIEDEVNRKIMYDKIVKGEPVEQVLKDVAKEVAEKPTPKNLRKAEVMLDTYRNYTTMTSAYENLKISQATNTLIKGELTPTNLADLKAEISAPKFADFEVTVSKWLAKNAKDNSAYDFLVANAGNSGILSMQKPSDLDAGFSKVIELNEKQQGGPLNLNQEAALAAGFDVAIPRFNQRMTGDINSRNPQASVNAANLYAALQRENPNVVAGVDNKAALKAMRINSLMRANTEPYEAWKDASDKLDNLTPSQVKENRERYEEQLKNHNLRNSPGAQTKFISKQLGFNPDTVPPGLRTDFMTALENNVVSGADWDDAVEQAKNQMMRSYKETTINGYKQVMYLAPDRNLPTMYVRNLMIDKASQLFGEMQKEYDYNAESGLPFYYKFPEGELRDITDPLKESRLSPKTQMVGVGMGFVRKQQASPHREIPVVRVEDGKEIKGTLLIQSDQYTDTPQPGHNPSYSMLFLREGALKPDLIYDPKTFSNARFEIVPEDLDVFNRVDKAAQKAADELAQEIIKLRGSVAQREGLFGDAFA